MLNQAFDNTEERLLEEGYPLTSQYYQGITGLAKRLALKYQQLNNEQDFCQTALLVACQSEHKFNPENGASFYTFASQPIKSAIQEAFGNSNAGSKLYRKLSKFILEFQTKEGTYPTMDDIVIGTKLSRFKIMEVYFTHSREVSLEDSEELMEDDNLWISEYLGVLTEEEQKVIELVFYEDKSIQEVAVTIGKSLQYANGMLVTSLGKLKGAINGTA